MTRFLKTIMQMSRPIIILKKEKPRLDKSNKPQKGPATTN
jgi:hypothetical protein